MSWVVGLAALAAVQGSPSMRFDLVCDIDRLTADFQPTGESSQERWSVDLITNRFCGRVSCSNGRWSDIDAVTDRELRFDDTPTLTFIVNRLTGSYRFHARGRGEPEIIWVGECERAPFTEHRRF